MFSSTGQFKVGVRLEFLETSKHARGANLWIKRRAVGTKSAGSEAMLRVAILTRHDDFHAFVVRQILEDQGVQCSIILTDSIAWDGGLSWSSSDEATPTVVRDMDGHEVAVAELHVVWWRRLTGEPRIPVALPTVPTNSSSTTVALHYSACY